MATTCFKPIKGKVMRITRLDACGVPVVGATSSIVSDGFVHVQPKFEYEDGQEYVVKNAWGDYCLNEQDDDRLKRVNLEVQFCIVDPDAAEIVLGSRLITAAGSSIGFGLSEAAASGRFGLEVWQKAGGTGGCAGGTQQWVYWAWPNVGSGRLNDFSIENGPLEFTMAARTKPAASAWGDGPYAASPMPASVVILSTEHMVGLVTTIAPPAAVACGATAIV